MQCGAYIGRFAPSPTGVLHFGSAAAAIASWLDARAHQGQWLVRMEDLDPPREVPGAATAILEALERMGLVSDAPVMFQSRRSQAYVEALEVLRSDERVFDCSCTRRSLSGHVVYPGTCRQSRRMDTRHAVRFLAGLGELAWLDAVAGPQQFDRAAIGDFIVHRSDGLWAYQLAVVVDDIAQGITHVVRGVDLLDSTPRQRMLFEALSVEPPQYAHLPVAENPTGQKLSKQTLAASIERADPIELWREVLSFLGQVPPEGQTLASLQTSAVRNWNMDKVPPKSAVRNAWMD
jgi:glutamyl-Q tRNA(Asp) synthetase